MAFSGLVDTVTYDVLDIIETGYRRAKIPSELVTAQMLEIGRKNLFLMFKALANGGAPLWTREENLVGLNEGKATVALPAGTLEVLKVSRMRITRLSGTPASSAGGTAANATDVDSSTLCQQVTPNGNVSLDMVDESIVHLMGAQLTAGTYALSFEVSDDNSNWTVVGTSSATVTDKAWLWVRLDPEVTVRYARVRETGGATLGVYEFVVAKDPDETVLGDYNQDDYQVVPDKSRKGTPHSYWFDKRASSPTLRVTLVPDATSSMTPLAVWRRRHLMDITSYTQQLELPVEWYDAVCWDLAVRLCAETPLVKPGVKAEIMPDRNNAMSLAWNANDPGDEFEMTADISMYTR